MSYVSTKSWDTNVGLLLLAGASLGCGAGNGGGSNAASANASPTASVGQGHSGQVTRPEVHLAPTPPGARWPAQRTTPSSGPSMGQRLPPSKSATSGTTSSTSELVARPISRTPPPFTPLSNGGGGDDCWTENCSPTRGPDRNDGAVMPNPQVYDVWIGLSSNGADYVWDNAFIDEMNQFNANFYPSLFYSDGMSQLGVTPDTSLAGHVYLSTTSSTLVINTGFNLAGGQDDVASIIQSAIGNGWLPPPQSASTGWGANTVYAVHLGGINIQKNGQTNCQSFCGFHEPVNEAIGGVTAYSAAILPDWNLCNDSCKGWVSNVNPQQGFDSYTKVLAHEIIESVTNPAGNTQGDLFCNTAPPGWGYADGCICGNACEVGDICNGNYQVLALPQTDGHRVFVNGSWDPTQGTCDISQSFAWESNVAAISRAPDTLDVFAVGVDGAVYHNAWPTGNTSWGWATVPQSGNQGPSNNWEMRSYADYFPTGAPLTVASASQNNLDLFVVGYDGALYTSNWNASIGWSTGGAWEQIAVSGLFSPATLTEAGSRVAALEVPQPDGTYVATLFAVDGAGTIWTTTALSDPNTGVPNWSPPDFNWWTSLGPVTTAHAEPTVVSLSATTMELFVVDSSGAVQWDHYDLENGGWAGFVPISPTNQTTPGQSVAADVRQAPDLYGNLNSTVDVFAVGPDGTVQANRWQNGWFVDASTNWANGGTGFPAMSSYTVYPGDRITVVSRDGSHVDIIGANYSSQVVHIGGTWNNPTDCFFPCPQCPQVCVPLPPSWNYTVETISDANFMTPSIAVTSRNPNQLDLFTAAYSPSGIAAIYTTWWSSGGGWNGSWPQLSNSSTQWFLQD